MKAAIHSQDTGGAPEGFTAITPFLMVEDADKVLDFARDAFGPEEVFVLRHADGTLWHAQLRIGGAMLMLADAMGKKDHVMPACLYLYADDVDRLYERAMAVGGESVMAPADQFYGDRNAGVRDMAGNVWWIARQVEKLSPAEMTRRAREFEKTCGQ